MRTGGRGFPSGRRDLGMKRIQRATKHPQSALRRSNGHRLARVTVPRPDGAEGGVELVRNAGDRERQKRMLRPNQPHEARQTGSRGGGSVKPLPATSEPQLDTVD